MDNVKKMIKAEVVKIPWDDEKKMESLCRDYRIERMSSGTYYCWSFDQRLIRKRHEYLILINGKARNACLEADLIDVPSEKGKKISCPADIYEWLFSRTLATIYYEAEGLEKEQALRVIEFLEQILERE